MPQVLEKPETVEAAPRKVSKAGSAVIVAVETNKSETPRTPGRFETRLRKAFKGHEEFLGWTPD